MTAPFFKYGLLGDSTNLVLALIIGIGFGFFLERGGLGNAVKLASQFYLDDLTVFKMMFTAIITAMGGLLILSLLGFVNLALIYVSPTYLIPQLVGGLVFGVGFVVGGYCPGTSCVALTTGRIDAFVLLLGMITGIFIFGEVFPFISDFYYSTYLGQITFDKLLNLPLSLAVCITIILAISGFWGGEKIEKKFNAKQTNNL
jgi:uncharacterized membrane protein YedE/YeeE